MSHARQSLTPRPLTVAAGALGLAFAAGLLMAASPRPGPEDPPEDKQRFTWPELPSDDQVRKVFIMRIAPGPNDPERINAQIRFEMGEGTQAVLPRLAKTGVQAAPPADDEAHTNTIPPRRMAVEFAALAADWKRYATDAEASDAIVQRHARASQTFAMKKVDFGPLTYGDDFPRDREIELTPWYRGTPRSAVPDRQTIINNCLMIVDTCVVNDARASNGGTWSFGYLMRQLANEPETGIRAEVFTRRWLRHWEETLLINGHIVPHRVQGITRLINGWPKTASGELDLDKAPFRLLAIISRLDLRNNLVLGAERIGGGGAGEGRFVFCALLDDQPLAFTVIFEYAIKKDDFAGVRHWARQWYYLKDLELGSPAYLDALEALTEQFARADADPESPPNRSALSQLRTNEIALEIPPLGQPGGEVPLWEVREFRLSAHNSGYLEPVTVKQNPDLKFNDTRRLADFINQNEYAILNKSHRTPVEFPAGQPFLGGSSITPVNFFWKVTRDPMNPNPQAPRIGDPAARHLFSLGTCNGCHAAETFRKVENFHGDDLSQDLIPPMFTHVRPRQADKAARLSPFLQGENNGDFILEDPDGQQDEHGQVIKRPFGDLSRRADDLHDLVQYGWYYELHRLPIQFVH